MHKIILIGGGGHCESVIDVIEAEARFEIYGIIDIESKVGKEILGYKIIGTDKDLEKIREDISYAFVTVGHIYSNQDRKNLFRLLRKLDFKIPAIFSPRAYVSKHSKINPGTVVMHNAVINASAIIGSDCIINTNAVVEHGANIGNNCHISTSVTINGNTKIGNNCFIGSNSTTKECIEISDNTFIKAGAIVK